MGDAVISHRHSLPSSHSRSAVQRPFMTSMHERDELRPMLVSSSRTRQSISAPEWAQQPPKLGAPPESAIPRLPSIREIFGESEPLDSNTRNAGPSPSTIADSPGPATPAGHYTHMRHESWPRTRSVDSFTTVPCEDRSALSTRIELADGVECNRPLDEDCRFPVSPRSRRLRYSHRLSWQQVSDTPREAGAFEVLPGRSDEPRVLPSLSSPLDYCSSELRRHVDGEPCRREEDYNTAFGQQNAYPVTQPCPPHWAATLSARAQNQNRHEYAPESGRAAFPQRPPFADAYAAGHGVPSVNNRSRSDPFSTGLNHTSTQAHSRSASSSYDRSPVGWGCRGNDASHYPVGATGPGNPFAHHIPLAAAGYGAPAGYHTAGPLERMDGSGPLAEMNKRKKRGNLPPEAKRVMNAWFKEHLNHPYPDEETKKKWIIETGLSQEQVSNFCINARRRDIKRMRKEAGLSPDIPFEPTPNGEALNHRKRRSSEWSPNKGEPQDGDSEKRRRCL